MASTVRIDDRRWGILRQFIVEIASGKFELPEYMPEEGDELDGIIQGLVMVAEELKISSVSRAYLDGIIASITDLLLILDKDFRIVQYNQPAKDYFKSFDDEMLETSFEELLESPETLTTSAKNIVVEHQGKVENVRINLSNRHGAFVPFSASFNYISSENNPRHNVLVVAKNVSTLVEIQRRLEESNDDLKTLIYRLSHDIRSPLTNILGLTDIMGSMLESLPEAQAAPINDVLGKIIFSAKKIDVILHYFNRLSVIQYELISEDVRLSSLFEHLENELREKFPKVEVEFRTILNADNVSLNCTRLLLTLILIQVLDNAFIYHYPGRALQIDIRSNIREGDLVLSIRDNGKGIPKDIREDIFDMFVKGHNRTEQAGMGLFFVKSALNQLKGKVDVWSKEGDGTTIELWIPIVQ